MRLIGRPHIIVELHRVHSEGSSPNLFDTCPSISEELLREILNNLRKQFEIVSLTAFSNRMNEDKPLAALTFDDGWKDNYYTALPILQEFDAKATFFLTTGRIGSCLPFWQQILGQAFQKISETRDLDERDRFKRFLGVRKAALLDVNLYEKIVAQWKHLRSSELEGKLAFLLNTNKSFKEERCFLSIEEIRKMAQLGMEFGSHTVNHLILTREPEDIIEKELGESKETIEKITGKPTHILAYPNGDFDERVITIARNVGYRIACSTQNKYVGRDCDPLKLPRIEYPIALRDTLKSFLKTEGKKTEHLITSYSHKGQEISQKTENRLNHPIRVMFVVDQIYGATAGTEQHLSFLMRNLPAKQYEIHLALVRDAGYYNSTMYPAEPVILNGDFDGSKFETAVSTRKLSHLISDRNIDLVHTFFPDSELIALIATRSGRKCGFVGTRRNMGFRHTWRSLWRTRFTNQFIPRFLANCHAVKEQIGRLEWIPESKIDVIPNPVNRKRTEEGMREPLLKQDLGIRNGELVVGIVANISPVKDHETFLRAAQVILRKQPQTKFLIVGGASSERKKWLESLISDLGLGRSVIYIGEIENSVRSMNTFDIGVLCSKSEGFSNSLIEYAAMGLPIVATGVGGNSEIVVQNETGFLVPPENPEELAQQIIRLLESKDLRRSFGEKARKLVEERFDQNKVIAAYEEFYQKIIKFKRV